MSWSMTPVRPRTRIQFFVRVGGSLKFGADEEGRREDRTAKVGKDRERSEEQSRLNITYEALLVRFSVFVGNKVAAG